MRRRPVATGYFHSHARVPLELSFRVDVLSPYAIPVVEERLVITGKLYLFEEIHVRRVERTETVEIPTITRCQTVQIDRLPQGEGADPAQSQKNKDDQGDQ